MAALLLLNTIILLFTGFVFYRLWLHPLSRFPGPVWGKITDLYVVYHMARHDRHLLIYRLHQKYGPIVRFGPNRLSVNTISGLKQLYGNKANTSKSRSYYPMLSHYFQSSNTLNIMNPKEHSFRRRILAQALSDTSIKLMDEAILANVRKFCDAMVDGQHTKATVEWSSPKNMAKWTDYLTFDIMGSVCFSHNFLLLTHERNRFLIEVLPATLNMVDIAGHISFPFKLKLDKLLPGKFTKDIKTFQALCKDQTEGRVAKGADDHLVDFYGFLLKFKDPDTGKGLTFSQLVSETSLLVPAGSDTAASALCSTLFYLAHDENILAKLNKEIRSTFSSVEDIRNNAQLSSCRYLRACIDEAMRMSTPLPVILYREALEGGVVIDGHHIPEGADIGIESYAIHHNEEYYPNSFKYDPERWIANEATGVSADSVYLAQSAFCPFSVGPRSCIGKAFAYKEMMLVMARLCFLFDMRLLPGSTLGEGGPELGWGRHRRHELQLEDSFVSKASGPLMQFRARLSTLT